MTRRGRQNLFLKFKARRAIEDFCTRCQCCELRTNAGRKVQGLGMRVQAKEAIAWIDVEGRKESVRNIQKLMIEIFWRLNLVY